MAASIGWVNIACIWQIYIVIGLQLSKNPNTLSKNMGLDFLDLGPRVHLCKGNNIYTYAYHTYFEHGGIYSQLTRGRKRKMDCFILIPSSMFSPLFHFLFCSKQSLKIYLVNKGQVKLERFL